MNESLRVLIVDDEPQIRRFLRVSLSAEGMQVFEAASLAEARSALRADKPDLMILDLGLPDGDGLELIPQVRESSSLPIIVLSVRDDEAGKVRALDAGADDYLTKPFGTGELLARIRAALRHRLLASGAQPIVESGELKIDLSLRRVTLAGVELKLSRKEYAILAVLAKHAGRVVTQPQILRDVWGKVHEDDTQYLRVYVGQLRHKLGDDAAAPRYLLTEPGVGYRLKV
ncbi:response regulator [Hydrocarboniphaga sp.]|uniref:response regulator n=1 Tax=Hydrocarboniphaga sp. TaxID=2033016 RepID=UPI003D0A78B5